MTTATKPINYNSELDASLHHCLYTYQLATDEDLLTGVNSNFIVKTAEQWENFAKSAKHLKKWSELTALFPCDHKPKDLASTAYSIAADLFFAASCCASSTKSSIQDLQGKVSILINKIQSEINCLREILTKSNFDRKIDKEKQIVAYENRIKSLENLKNNIGYKFFACESNFSTKSDSYYNHQEKRLLSKSLKCLNSLIKNEKSAEKIKSYQERKSKITERIGALSDK